MATLKDVAKDAGVSIATVSCCLSGAKNVKPETKSRVMDSVEKLKYIPNASARNLKTTDSKRIGVILTDIDNLYHAEIFKGISTCLQSNNYTVNVAFSNNLPDIESEKIDDFISQNISGLILITCQPQNVSFFQSRILNYNIPAVFIERRPDSVPISSVAFDNYQTTFFITDSLLKKGYRKIALVTGSRLFSSEKECIAGYINAFSERNLTHDSAFIQTTNMSKEDAFQTALLHLPLKETEAVITTSENIAQGVLEAFQIYGLKVFHNFHLITFGEENWSSVSQIPGVVYTSRTAYTLGSRAAALLMDNIKTQPHSEETILFSDGIIKSPLDIPLADTRKPWKSNIKQLSEGLHILMSEMPTSHSIRMLSESFTNQTGIPADFDFLPQNELLSKIITDVNSGRNEYDIYMYDVPWLRYLVQNSLLGDLTDFLADNYYLNDTFFKENLENCRYEVRYYGIPLIGGAQIMFYRKDLFENREISKQFQKDFQLPLRPPRTWTEFNGIAKFFTKSYNPSSPTEYGTSVAGIMDEELAPEILIRLWAYGGKIWDSYNRACLNIPQNQRAYESILETLNYSRHPAFHTSIVDTITDFSAGQTAMLITYSEYASQINQSINHNIIGRAGYEILPGKAPMSIGWNFGLNPYTPKAEYACLYFHWLCRHKTSYYMTILDGQSPVTAPYHSHELLKLYPWMEITEKSFQYSHQRTGPRYPNSLVIPQNKIETILCNVLRMVLSKGLSIQDALSHGQEQMVSLFRSYGYPKPLHFI